MKYYTNREIKNQENLQGTVTLYTYEDIYGKYSGMLLPKGSEIVVSGAQVDSVWSIIKDGDSALDIILDIDWSSNEQFELSYVLGKTNFVVQSVNC